MTLNLNQVIYRPILQDYYKIWVRLDLGPSIVNVILKKDYVRMVLGQGTVFGNKFGYTIVYRYFKYRKI
jgi:hypothetical protein